MCAAANISFLFKLYFMGFSMLMVEKSCRALIETIQVWPPEIIYHIVMHSIILTFIHERQMQLWTESLSCATNKYSKLFYKCFNFDNSNGGKLKCTRARENKMNRWWNKYSSQEMMFCTSLQGTRNFLNIHITDTTKKSTLTDSQIQNNNYWIKLPNKFM